MEPDTHTAGLLSLQLDAFKNHCDELAGLWNGDDAGKLEEQAGVCNEIVETIDRLEELLAEFGNL